MNSFGSDRVVLGTIISSEKGEAVMAIQIQANSLQITLICE